MSNFRLEGFDNVLNLIKQLPDKVKKQTVAGIMKKNLQPVKEAIKAGAPKRDLSSYQGTITRKRKDGSVSSTARPGNLKKAVGIKQFTKGEKVSVFAGVQKKNDAVYYGSMVEKGTKFQQGQHFVERAANATMPLATANLEKDTIDYIVKNAQKLGLQAK